MAGFLKHLESCNVSPSGKQRAADNAKRKGQELAAARDKALALVTQKVGDVIHYWHEAITKPTHVLRFGRMVRVRYEEEKLFRAYSSAIDTIDFDGLQVAFNRSVRMGQVCESREDAERIAKDKQACWDEHVHHSQMCR